MPNYRARKWVPTCEVRGLSCMEGHLNIWILLYKWYKLGNMVYMAMREQNKPQSAVSKGLCKAFQEDVGAFLPRASDVY